MAITVTCRSCKQKYQVRDHLAGKSVSCRECGAPVQVPKLTPEDADDFDDGPAEYSVPKSAAEEPKPVIARKSERTPASERVLSRSSHDMPARQSRSGKPQTPAIYLGVAAVLVVIVIVLINAVGPSSEPVADTAPANPFQGGGNASQAPALAKPIAKPTSAANALPAEPSVSPQVADSADTVAPRPAEIVIGDGNRPWNVTINAPEEPLEIELKKKTLAAIPKNSTGDVVLPDCPSSFVALGSNNTNREIREVRDLRTNRKLGAVRAAQIPAGLTALSPDGLHFAAWGFGQSNIDVWDIKTERPKGRLKSEGDSYPRLLMFAGNDRLIAAGNNPDLLRWSIPAGQPEAKIALPQISRDRAGGLSPGGRFLALAGEETKSLFIRVLDLTTGENAGEISLTGFDGGLPRCFGIAFSPDGEEIAALYDSTRASSIFVFHTASGKLAEHIRFDGNLQKAVNANNSTGVHSLEWFPSRDRLFVFGQGVVDRTAGKVVWVMPGDQQPGKPALRRVLDEAHLLTVAFDKKEAALVAYKLPTADIKRSTEIVSAGGLAIDAHLPQLTGADWSAPAAPTTPAAKQPWNVQPDPATPATQKLLETPVALASKNATIKSVTLAGAQAARAVVMHTAIAPTRTVVPEKSSRNTKKKSAAVETLAPAWLTLVDLAAGTESGAVEIPFDCDLASVSLDGKRALLRLSEGDDRLDVWSLDDKQPVVAWRPYMSEKNHAVTAALFVDSDHVLTTNMAGKLAVWELPACRAIYTIDLAPVATLSPNRKYLAVPGDKKIRFFETLKGEPCGDLEVAGEMRAAVFHPDGERFAAIVAGGAGPRLVCWNLSDGRIEADFLLPVAGDSLQFCSNGYLLLDNSTLIDLDHKMIVWKYLLPSGIHLSESPDGRHWYAAPVSPRAKGLSLVATALPEPRAQAKLAHAAFDTDMVIQPGARVSLKIELSAVPPGRPRMAQELTQAFTERFARNKIAVAENQNVVVTVKMAHRLTGQQPSVEIEQSVQGKLKREKIPVPQLVIECSILFRHKGKVVWESKTNLTSTAALYRVPEGKPAAQFVNESVWESAANFLLKFDPPTFVFADTAVDGLGTSPLTAETAAAAR